MKDVFSEEVNCPGLQNENWGQRVLQAEKTASAMYLDFIQVKSKITDGYIAGK